MNLLVDFVFEQLNPHSCKTYLFGLKGAKEVIIVDPLLDHVQDYRKLLEQRYLRVAAILETHTHADHISGAAALKDITDAELVMHDNAPAQCVTKRVSDGVKLTIAGVPVSILFTPGHTQDSVSYILLGKILTGDALFLDDGGAGRDDLPSGDPGAHWETLQKITKLPEDLIVYPAHEYRDRKPSPLSQQKKTNPHLKQRTKDEFIEYITDLQLGSTDWMKDVLKANYACARNPGAAWIPVDSPACEVKGTLAANVNSQQVFSLSPEALFTKLNAGSSPLMIDVREPSELKGQLEQLPGVKNIPIGSLIANLKSLATYKDQEIVLICRSGGRAGTAAQIMKQAGFLHPLVLEGGMTAWRSKFSFKF